LLIIPYKQFEVVQTYIILECQACSPSCVIGKVQKSWRFQSSWEWHCVFRWVVPEYSKCPWQVGSYAATTLWPSWGVVVP